MEITQFFNHLMTIVGGCTCPGLPILSCFMNPEKRFAFMEFRSVEETSNAMAFDGVQFKGETLKIRRPHDYNSSAAILLGPTEPNSNLNLAALGLVNTVVTDGPNKLFIGGLPSYLSEEQVPYTNKPQQMVHIEIYSPHTPSGRLEGIIVCIV